MKVTLLHASSTNKMLASLMESEDEFYWAVAWATETELFTTLLKHKKKIRQLVVGTDFAQTHPAVLEGLLPVQAAKVARAKAGATFHPKVYCFVSGNEIKAIVGSANFTGGGTGSNQEACLLLEGSARDQVLNDVLKSVREWWGSSTSFDDNFVRSYWLKWHANQRLRKEIEKPTYVFKPNINAAMPDMAFMSWKEYLDWINKDKYHSVDGRLAVLDKAREIFQCSMNFSGASDLERSAISGFIGKNQRVGTDLDGIEWGWFGSMKGAGSFKNVINSNSRHISLALECIPMIGEVTEEDYLDFVAHFRRGFEGVARKGGVATASRLLAMKRPDYFVCLDSQNKRGITKSGG